MGNLDRRQFLAGGLKAGAALGAVGVGGTLLEACGSSKTTKPPTTVSKSKALQIGVNNGKPKLGGSISFGTEAEETGMDPTYAHYDSTGVDYARAVFDPLAIILENGSVAPYLAESIVPNKTYDQWTITVRKNIVFHDGTPCDGKALQFCMQEFLKSGLTNFAFTDYMSTTSPQTAVTLAGPRTIVMHMEQPWVPFDYWLAGYIGGQIAYMFSPTAYMKGESSFDLHPVGTGPFVYEDWVPGNYFKLTKNPNYWRTDKWGNKLPYLDSWTFRPQPDVGTRYSYLEAGTIQMMHTDDDPTIIQIAGNSKLDNIRDDELSLGEPDCNFAMVNCQDPVMKDVRLRQALAYATNQKEINDITGKNITKGIQGVFPEGNRYYNNTNYPSYDLSKAKALVASWSKDNGGKAPSITYSSVASPSSTAAAAVVQAMWEQAGFKVSTSTVQQAAEIDDALEGKYQVFAWRQFANVNPDLNYIFWSKVAGPINFARNFDDKIQAALDKARQSTDPSVQTAAYQEVDDRLAVDLPYIFFSRDVWCVCADKSVQNWNNPTAPSGQRGLTMLSGIIWPTEVWLDT